VADDALKDIPKNGILTNLSVKMLYMIYIGYILIALMHISDILADAIYIHIYIGLTCFSRLDSFLLYIFWNLKLRLRYSASNTVML
jgi:hypothetical protein